MSAKQASVNRKTLDEIGAIVASGAYESDRAYDLIDEVLEVVLADADRVGVEKMTSERRVFLAICELDIGAKSEGLAYTLVNGVALIPSMREAAQALNLPALDALLDDALALIPPDILRGDDAAKTDAWLDSPSDELIASFEELEDRFIEEEPAIGYAGVALRWVATHRAAFAG